ncbi:MAG: hypothetical protein FWE45_00085 [Firmicutes bacterium]|nr:hypothetical protein [Bacillota bacterium]
MKNIITMILLALSIVGAVFMIVALAVSGDLIIEPGFTGMAYLIGLLVFFVGMTVFFMLKLLNKADAFHWLVLVVTGIVVTVFMFITAVDVLTTEQFALVPDNIHRATVIYGSFPIFGMMLIAGVMPIVFGLKQFFSKEKK